MIDIDKLRTKIRALLAKAASTDNEAEAELFFAKAKDLMEEHQLSATDLHTEDAVGEEHAYQRGGAAAPDWDFALLFQVARYYGCYGIQNERYGYNQKGVYSWLGHDMILIGRESARVTTIEMHKYLVATVRRLGREKCGQLYDEYDRPLKPDTAARRIGHALRDRLHHITPRPKKDAPTAAGKNALVTLDEVEAWTKQHHPDLSSIKGQSLRNDGASTIADGINLNLQMGKDKPLALK